MCHCLEPAGTSSFRCTKTLRADTFLITRGCGWRQLLVQERVEGGVNVGEDGGGRGGGSDLMVTLAH